MADPTVQITQPDGKEGERNACGSCRAAQLEQRGQLLCRLNPPGRSPSGVAFWPTVAATDWCMQWSPIDG
jgi:hypothetical protein